MTGGDPAGGQHRSAKREWKRKNRVLPLDHLEGSCNVVNQSHGLILNERHSLACCRREAACSPLSVALFPHQRHKAARIEGLSLDAFIVLADEP
jgi:hypothetical protein